ncbi:MAG: protease inhibitor I42 family protein [Nitrososphaeraceae archaeon]
MQNEIKVKVGDDFTIGLEGNPTTGYIWEISSSTDYLHLMKVIDTYWKVDRSIVGAAAIQNFVFKSLSVGSLALTFRYARPWEKENYLEERIFHIQIVDN